MNRSEKQVEIDALHEKMAKATFVAAIAHDRLDASTAIELRRAMRAGKIDYKVVKNTLALRAAKGTAVEKLAASFAGPVAVAIGYDDVVAAAKTVVDFVKKAPLNLKVVSGVAAGEQLDASGVEALSKVPSLPETRAQLLAMFNTPASRIARALQAHVDKQGGTGEQAA
jgi:large subunit ribosomal protein L10